MGFSLGAPRSFQFSPDGDTVIFLRSRGGADPVTCLWALDVTTGQERLIADPKELGRSEAENDPIEQEGNGFANGPAALSSSPPMAAALSQRLPSAGLFTWPICGPAARRPSASS